ncbi:MAG: hypothetical protein LBV66_00320, partial [Elusimicrobiota bacterium]|nr:hypothetical protein [Elusimicrobiota bacterium]
MKQRKNLFGFLMIAVIMLVWSFAGADLITITSWNELTNQYTNITTNDRTLIISIDLTPSTTPDILSPANWTNLTISGGSSLKYLDGNSNPGFRVNNNQMINFNYIGFENFLTTDGGAIYLNNSTASFTVSNTFNTNSAKLGGAVYINYGNAHFTNSSEMNFINNGSQSDAGAIYIDGGNIESENNSAVVFATNTASRGGAVFMRKGTVPPASFIFRNNSVFFTTNTAEISGG